MSTRNDEELERLVREVAAREPVPEFEQIWRRAKARVGKAGSRGGAWQWALGPALVAVSIAVVVVAARGLPVAETPVAPIAGGVQADNPIVAVADAGAGASTARTEEPDKAESATETDGLYVAGTDFLLEMDLPTWN
ncbi:MAG: hypothetical protein M0R80_24455 [Proteobacteria bacterium]|jgi:hypothetical protein|nr:hypothetical protein [Pseudomonadota bacterium]